MEERLLEALKNVMNIVNESTGVAGYHLNGEIAEWDRFEEIIDADSLIAECEGKTHNASTNTLPIQRVTASTLPRTEKIKKVISTWYYTRNREILNDEFLNELASSIDIALT